MAKVSVPRDQITDGSLPSVCIVCGQEASHRRFPGVSSPSMAWVLVSPLIGLLGLWAYILVGGGQPRDRAAGFPFCDRHRSYWTVRAWIIIGGFLALVALIGIGFALTPPAGPGKKPEPHWLFSVAGGLLLLYLPILLFVHLSAVRPTSSDAEAIVLSGANRRFADALSGDDIRD
jgi:hypothetical protein